MITVSMAQEETTTAEPAKTSTETLMTTTAEPAKTKKMKFYTFVFSRKQQRGARTLAHACTQHVHSGPLVSCASG